MSDKKTFPQVEYAIFDMDGLLKDIYRRDEYAPKALTAGDLLAERTYIILARYGHQMTWEIKSGIMGKVARQAAEYLYSFFPGLEDQLSIDDYITERNKLQMELFRKVKPMEGAVNLVRGLYAAGVPIAIATGSNKMNFEYKTSHLPELFKLFPPTSIVMADSDHIPPGRGKPFPDIFLAAARSLGKDVGTAEECTPEQAEMRKRGIIFEDATLGCNAGVAAGMNVIWVPDDQLRALDPTNDYGAAQVLKSLEEFDPSAWGLPFKHDDV